MQIVRELPADLTQTLFDLGPRRLVFVEGTDDSSILREWYRERQSRIYFHPVGGDRNVVKKLDAVEGHEVAKRTYGIRDRDFRTDAQNQADAERYGGRLFTLPRYSIENYILDPEAVWEELRLFVGERFSLQNPEAMRGRILEICQGLHLMMAANWVFSERSREEEVPYFPPGQDDASRETLLELAKRRLNLPVSEVRSLIAAKEAAIGPSLAGLESAHEFINGKHLLHRLHKAATTERQGLSRDHFRNLLARTVATKLGIPEDIRLIIERGILDRAQDTVP